MPVIYACSNCNYRVSLGWLHYHVAGSGWNSETRLLCEECGTVHVIKEAPPREMQEEIQLRANVVIDDLGSQFYEVRRVLREATNYNRRQANAVLDSMPGVFVSNVSYSTAQKILGKLERLNVLAHVDVTHEVEYREDIIFALIPKKSEEYQLCEIKGEYDAKTARIDLEKQECGFCHARGSLISELKS